MAINNREIVPDCKLANCRHLIDTGKCLDECLKRYRAELGLRAEAKWKHRAEHNDFIWAECSNCGFREETRKVVYKGCSDTEYVDVKWKYCPMCGKSMGV